MKHLNFLQLAVFTIALMSLATHSSWAQTTITLPQACNCPSATDADGDGVADAKRLSKLLIPISSETFKKNTFPTHRLNESKVFNGAMTFKPQV